MQSYPIHAEGTSFVQPNEARHIQTGVSGSAKRPRPLPAEMKVDRREWPGTRVALTANGGSHAGAERIFTITDVDGALTFRIICLTSLPDVLRKTNSPFEKPDEPHFE